MEANVERITQAVLFVDIVESTRLLEEDEELTIARWRGMVDYIEKQVVQDHGGRLIKSTGDGVLLSFFDCKSATLAAFEIQQASSRDNSTMAADRQILLRIAIEICDVIVDRHDIYGRGVMLAVRLMTLAGPGEIIISANVRDQLIPTLDADVEDLGECYLKHVQHPVRAYRIGPVGPRPVIEFGLNVGPLLPTIAVIPFTRHSSDVDHDVVGEVLATEIINALSHSSELHVISRLSTTAFRGRDIGYTKIGQHLNANYVLSGIYRVDHGCLIIDTELTEVKSGQIVWHKQLRGRLDGLLTSGQEITTCIVVSVNAAIAVSELKNAFSQPLPTLESYTLLVSAITLMHKLSYDNFNESHKMLQTLVGRATRQSLPHAWLANWHVLKVQQGWSDDPDRDGQLALDCTKRALDANPCSSLALTINGFVHTNLMNRLDIGNECYQLALDNNPNEALAWLLKGTLHAFEGNGHQAVADTKRALDLTPMDPLRYFYDSLAATACLSAHQYENARVLAQRSKSANRVHTSTYRVLAAAQWFLGMHDEARGTAQELMQLEPNLTVRGWLARSPSSTNSIGTEWANVLREVGIPD